MYFSPSFPCFVDRRERFLRHSDKSKMEKQIRRREVHGGADRAGIYGGGEPPFACGTSEHNRAVRCLYGETQLLSRDGVRGRWFPAQGAAQQTSARLYGGTCDELGETVRRGKYAQSAQTRTHTQRMSMSKHRPTGIDCRASPIYTT